MRWVCLPVVVLLFGVSPGRADTVLVLPFFNISPSPKLDWVGESAAETIRESLAAQGLLILGRQEREEAFRRLSVRPYVLLTRASVVKIGQALDADRVVFGQFEVTETGPNASFRMAAREVDLKRIKQSGEFAEAGALADLAAVESRLAWRILRHLAPGEAPSQEQFRKNHPLVRIDAMENYIRGLLAGSPEQKIKLFTQAARLDPQFSPPCFHLGRMYTDRKEYRFAIDWLERVGTRDSHYLEARFLLGLCRYYTGDFAAAESAFRIVAGEVPLNEVFNNMAAAQSRRSDAKAAENFGKAIEGDSADSDYRFNLGYTLWKQGKFEEAADSFRSALDRQPADIDATLLLGRCIMKAGPRPGDPRSDGLERLKLNYEETAYRQLKAALAK